MEAADYQAKINRINELKIAIPQLDVELKAKKAWIKACPELRAAMLKELQTLQAEIGLK